MTNAHIDLKLAAIWSNAIYLFLTVVAIVFLYLYKYRHTPKNVYFRPVVWMLLFTMFFQACTSLGHHIYLQFHPDTSSHTKKMLTVFIFNCIFVFTICIACIFIILHKVLSSYMSYFYKLTILFFIMAAVIFFILNVVYEHVYDIYTLYYLMWHFCTFIAFMLTIKFIFYNKEVFETSAKIQFSFEKWLVWLLFFF